MTVTFGYSFVRVLAWTLIWAVLLGADLLTLHEELNLSNTLCNCFFVQLRIAKVKPSRKVPLISTWSARSRHCQQFFS